MMQQPFLDAIVATDSWQRWIREFLVSIDGGVVLPLRDAEVTLEPIPPETSGSVRDRIMTSSEFGLLRIQNELKPYGIDVSVGSGSSGSRVHVYFHR